LILSITLLLVGCVRAGHIDGDGDGVLAATDCDDDNAAIHPGAEEICDGFDNDCDDQIDEPDAADVSTWYYDGDGDGFGNEFLTKESCRQPSGYVEIAGDCDDDNASENPDRVWYEDADGDGFGTDLATTTSCEQPEGYVSDNISVDCDDSDPAYHPGADEDDCADPNDYNCDGSVGYEDEDEDGYAACEECDDGDARINPGAEERCDGVDNNCDAYIDEDSAVDASTWYLDYDGDGYGGVAYSLTQCDQPDNFVQGADDCDDLNATTYPGAAESCDEQDNDCDGAVDEDPAVDAPTWYADVDGDGFGTADESLDTCAQPSGYVDNTEDCDDSLADTYPEADERCDAVDNDCDGAIDEDDAVDAPAWYEDLDQDGYGNSAVAALACSQPSGFTEASGDCDETDAAVNPDAVEICDGQDNDCNGVADDDDASDAETWYLDSDGDGFGEALVTTTACAQPVGYVAQEVATDCDDAVAEINPDAEEICNDGLDNNCSGTAEACELGLETADLVLMGYAAGDQAGKSLSNIGDLDGDGYDTLLVAARSAYATAGAVYLLDGPLSAGSSVLDTSLAEAVIHGEAIGEYAAVSSTDGGDFDGDGSLDFAVGSAVPDSQAGKVWIMLSTPAGETSWADAEATFSGEDGWDWAGGPDAVATLGDVDGDGSDELLVGAYGADPNGSASGVAYLIYGPLTAGDYELASLADSFLGTDVNDRAGNVVAAPGDVNGDGLADIMVASQYPDSDTGRVWLQHGPSSGAITLSDADITLTGEVAGDRAGTSARGAGDLDGDGYDDILVGATHDDDGGVDAGATYVLFGPVSSGDLSEAQVKITGGETSGLFGAALDGGGDVDGDGSLDLLVGASNEGASAEGAAYLFLGPITPASASLTSADADASFLGGMTSDAAGSSVALTGDLDGSGLAAVAIGAADGDEGGTDAGSVHLVFGIGE